MKLTIGFSRPKAWFIPFAWLIMWYGKTNYSHAYIKIRSDSLDRDLIYQASSTMVNFMGSDIFDANENIVAEYEYEVDDSKKTTLLQFLVDKAGTPYGTLQVLGILLNKQFGWKLFQNGDKDFVCSELVARVLYGLDVPENFSSLDYVMPKDVRDMLDASPTIFKRTT